MASTFVDDILRMAANAEDGCSTNIKTIVRGGEFKMRMTVSDGINTITADVFGEEARRVYREILDYVE